MKLKLWGTRGSLPRAMNHLQAVEVIRTFIQKAEEKGVKTLSELTKQLPGPSPEVPIVYGGNTTCSEISHSNMRFLVDMGTGITEAGHQALSKGEKEFVIFQTHMHWDHIMGLPFFVPIYIPGNKITIYHVHRNAPEFIRLQFNGVNFPVKWDELAANIEFKLLKPYETVSFQDLTVTPFNLDHPGGSFGYRFDAVGKSVALGVDGEYKRLTPKELGADLKFYQNLDVLVFDAQYEMDELASRFDWGHCSPPIGVDLALREGIRNLILTHHDPRSSEEKSQRMRDHAARYATAELNNYRELWNKIRQPQGPIIRSAYDGLEMDLHSPS